MLFHVYKEEKPEGFFLNEPQGLYKYLLDADWIMYLLLPLLLLIIIILLMYLWRLHELPQHRAQQKKLAQAELVSALTILGLFQHWVWAVALFIAYTNWENVENLFVRILRRAHTDQPIESIERTEPPTETTEEIEQTQNKSDSETNRSDETQTSATNNNSNHKTEKTNHQEGETA
ncbi:hypothetical protein GCM10009007_15600 [Formosimonas limnophila]|uniref:Uncharacterized protein n=1 Tax=Formosimonas limnophila TaxID=1384487 RepID=A0A8J3CND6_9BURK|nr:hypothetical protein [Formosimonas limnophila]GHA75335.1 hypothetical protein GCM10009007_15600 [Formosimonas limnophila]